MIEHAYVILVSAIPALYRAWDNSPNAVAYRMNRLLLDKAILWCQDYQSQTGRDVDSFEEYG